MEQFRFPESNGATDPHNRTAGRRGRSEEVSDAGVQRSARLASVIMRTELPEMETSPSQRSPRITVRRVGSVTIDARRP
jgi:hypothetical protein